MQPLEFYTCSTLFDLSNKRNWDTMLQIISLRAQPVSLNDPIVVDANLSFYSFGSMHQGLRRIWTFEFGIEAKGAFKQGEDPVAALMKDSVMVPMTVGLNETTVLEPACIITNDELRNTYFVQLSR